MKTWMINYFNVVPCHPLYVKIQSNHVTWTSYSLLHEKKKLWKRYCFERFPWAWFEMEWSADKCILSILLTTPRRTPKSLRSALLTRLCLHVYISNALFFIDGYRTFLFLNAEGQEHKQLVSQLFSWLTTRGHQTHTPHGLYLELHFPSCLLTTSSPVFNTMDTI